MTSLPVVDLEHRDARRRIDAAWREIGFVSVLGHGIDVSLFDAMQDLLRRLFALDDETKRRHRITRDDYRGFIPLGFFTPNRPDVTGRAADEYEGFKLHWECPPEHPARAACRLYGANRWVPEIPDMADVVTAYWSACDELAGRFLDLIADALDEEGASFHGRFDAPLTNMTLLHYPPTRTGAEVAFHPHADTNVITLLGPDPAGGLDVRSPDGSWVRADRPPEALLVNTGEMLEVWSGGRWMATPHRVVRGGEDGGGAERYAYPFFVVPGHDVVVEPLIDSRAGFEPSAMPVGELTAEVWRTNWPDEIASSERFDLGTLDRDAQKFSQ